MCVASGSELVPLEFIDGIPSAKKLKLPAQCNYYWPHWI
jgi:hypothetical protein